MGEKPIGQRDQREKYDNPHQRSHEFPFLSGKILWKAHGSTPGFPLYATQQISVNISTSRGCVLELCAADGTGDASWRFGGCDTRLAYSVVVYGRYPSDC